MKSPDRIEALQWLRLLGAFGIVLFHCTTITGLKYVGGAGIIIFLFLTAFLGTLSTSGNEFKSFVKRRASRILEPWLFWSAFYFCLVLARASRGNYSWFESLTPWTLVDGTWYHLWYLPYAFVASLAIVYLKPKFENTKISQVVMVCAVLSVLLWGVRLWLRREYGLSAGAGMWLAGFALLPTGYGAARARELVSPGPRHKALAFLFLAPIGFNLIPLSLYSEPDCISIVLGLALLWFVPELRLPSVKFIDRLAATSLGVYLLHPFIIECAYQLPVKLPFWTAIWFVFLSSVVLTGIMGSLPVLRRFASAS